VGLDVQGFVRVRDDGNLVFRHWPDMPEGLPHVTFLKVDRAEAELLTGQADFQVAARKLASYGPREIVMTQSSGVTVYARGELVSSAFHASVTGGPHRTGRHVFCHLYRQTTDGLTPGKPADGQPPSTTLKQEQAGPWRGA